MFSEYIRQVQQEAEAAYPNEAVWLITKDGCKQVTNVHTEPEHHFSVAPEDVLKARQAGLLAVVHSHCDNPPVPSRKDMEGQIATGVPWGVLTATQHKLTAEASVVASDVTWWGVSDIPPLEGRKFAHGASDCYTLVLDYYRLHRGVDIGDVPRDWTWHEDGQDYFDALFEDKGFVEVPLSEAREGDALLICYRGTMPQHCGILLGTDRILHHPGSSNPIDGRKLSVVEPIGRYTRYIKRVLRLTE